MPAGRLRLPRAAPELATCSGQRGWGRGARDPFPSGSTWPGQVLPPPLPAQGRRAAAGRGHDVTAGGGAGGPSIPAEEPRPRSPIPSLPPASRRDFLFLCGAPGFARRRLPAADKTRSLGEGRRRQSRGPGAGGQRGSGPRPTGAGARLHGLRPPALRAPQHPSPAQGWHPGQHPARAAAARARTHAGPQHPDAPGRPAPTRGAAVGAARVPRPLQQLEHGLPPLLGHGRDAAWGAPAPPH